ncbi:hypothetical protein PIROE2DRAFT_21252 [Piromyces sp. E2]|nr:hypothetical protein PIROE2DRAFT_21252 [Piromyces sp. E2]|eukprot:OUM59369.1 hypothetical protein PIROE2DRAFT_21252 [Piromyces sp. E2]
MGIDKSHNKRNNSEEDNNNQEHLAKRTKISEDSNLNSNNKDDLNPKVNNDETNGTINNSEDNNIQKDINNENDEMTRIYDNPYYPTNQIFKKELYHLRLLVQKVQVTTDPKKKEIYQKKIKIGETKFQKFKDEYPTILAIYDMNNKKANKSESLKRQKKNSLGSSNNATTNTTSKYINSSSNSNMPSDKNSAQHSSSTSNILTTEDDIISKDKEKSNNKQKEVIQNNKSPLDINLSEPTSIASSPILSLQTKSSHTLSSPINIDNNSSSKINTSPPPSDNSKVSENNNLSPTSSLKNALAALIKSKFNNNSNTNKTNPTTNTSSKEISTTSNLSTSNSMISKLTTLNLITSNTTTPVVTTSNPTTPIPITSIPSSVSPILTTRIPITNQSITIPSNINLLNTNISNKNSPSPSSSSPINSNNSIHRINPLIPLRSSNMHRPQRTNSTPVSSSSMPIIPRVNSNPVQKSSLPLANVPVNKNPKFFNSSSYNNIVINNIQNISTVIPPNINQTLNTLNPSPLMTNPSSFLLNQVAANSNLIDQNGSFQNILQRIPNNIQNSFTPTVQILPNLIQPLTSPQPNLNMLIPPNKNLIQNPFINLNPGPLPLMTSKPGISPSLPVCGTTTSFSTPTIPIVPNPFSTAVNPLNPNINITQPINKTSPQGNTHTAILPPPPSLPPQATFSPPLNSNIETIIIDDDPVESTPKTKASAEEKTDHSGNRNGQSDKNSEDNDSSNLNKLNSDDMDLIQLQINYLKMFNSKKKEKEEEASANHEDKNKSSDTDTNKNPNESNDTINTNKNPGESNDDTTNTNKNPDESNDTTDVNKNPSESNDDTSNANKNPNEIHDSTNKNDSIIVNNATNEKDGENNHNHRESDSQLNSNNISNNNKTTNEKGETVHSVNSSENKDHNKENSKDNEQQNNAESLESNDKNNSTNNRENNNINIIGINKVDSPNTINFVKSNDNHKEKTDVVQNNGDAHSDSITTTNQNPINIVGSNKNKTAKEPSISIVGSNKSDKEKTNTINIIGSNKNKNKNVSSDTSTPVIVNNDNVSLDLDLDSPDLPDAISILTGIVSHSQEIPTRGQSIPSIPVSNFKSVINRSNVPKDSELNSSSAKSVLSPMNKRSNSDNEIVLKDKTKRHKADAKDSMEIDTVALDSTSNDDIVIISSGNINNVVKETDKQQTLSNQNDNKEPSHKTTNTSSINTNDTNRTSSTNKNNDSNKEKENNTEMDVDVNIENNNSSNNNNNDKDDKAKNIVSVKKEKTDKKSVLDSEKKNKVEEIIIDVDDDDDGDTNTTIDKSQTIEKEPLTEKEKEKEKDENSNGLENGNKDEILSIYSKVRFHNHSDSYHEHVLRLYAKKYINKGHNITRNKDKIKMERINDVFSNAKMELIEKALEVVKEIFVSIPFPLSTMPDPYLRVYRLLMINVTNKKELKDIDFLTRILFNFLLETRNSIQNDSIYCCKKLNKRPIISVQLATEIQNSCREKYKNCNEQELIAISNKLDYQWSALEFLLQRMDKSYCAFRINNKNIFPSFKDI